MSPVPGLGGVRGLRRPGSSMSSRSYDNDSGSLKGNESPRIIGLGLGIAMPDDDDRGEEILMGEDSETEEVVDRFSLKVVEAKKAVEAVSSFCLNIKRKRDTHDFLSYLFRRFQNENMKNC